MYGIRISLKDKNRRYTISPEEKLKHYRIVSPEEQFKQIWQHADANFLGIKKKKAEQAIKTAQASFDTPEYQASLKRSRRSFKALIKEMQEYDYKQMRESIIRAVKWLNFQIKKYNKANKNRMKVFSMNINRSLYR